MELLIGRNQNTFDEVVTTDYDVGDTDAITIAAPNPLRTHFTVVLTGEDLNQDVHIRYYPAGDDNEKHGEDLLVRRIQGNQRFYILRHTMKGDHPYTGEISAISEQGTHKITVTEMVVTPP